MRITRGLLPPALCVVLLLDSVLTLLPAPVNVHVDSVNFHHVLRWDPGPGTPRGTQYQVYKVRGSRLFTSVRGAGRHRLKSDLTTTSVQLKLKNPRSTFTLAVQASYNQTLSNDSRVLFTPYEHTKIGPPGLSLAGCGTCIRINVSLPQPDGSSGVDDIHMFYHPTYRVSVRKHEGQEVTYNTENKSFTISNLERGTEYCIKVHTMIRLNANTKPSDWKCDFTSAAPLNTGSVVIAVAAVQIFVTGCLVASVFVLCYTGLICNLKATLPTALMVALSHRGYTLSLERTTPDHISVSLGRGPRHGNTTTPRPASRGTSSEEEDEEEEDEEGEGVKLYMDRATDLSSGQTSSGDVDRTAAAASHGAGSWTVKAELPEADVAHQELDEEAAKDEGAEVSFFPQEAHSFQGCATGEEEEEEEACDSSGNADLFSVTLGALAVSEEEEQDTRDLLTDLSKQPDLQPLLPTDSPSPSHTDSQTESDDQTAAALLLPEDSTRTGSEDSLSVCLKACDGETQPGDEEEEEEEEEEFSGYIQHT